MRFRKLFQATLVGWLILAGAGFPCTGCKSSSPAPDEASPGVSGSPEGKTSTSPQGIAYTRFDERREPDALELAEQDKRFSTLVELIRLAQVENAVKNQGPLTVFAPTNEAFQTLPAEVVEKLQDPENRQALTYVLVHHVAPSNYPIEKLRELAKKGVTLFMASGEYVKVEEENGTLVVGGARILESHKVANGWVHVVDRPIVPEKLEL